MTLSTLAIEIQTCLFYEIFLKYFSAFWNMTYYLLFEGMIDEYVQHLFCLNLIALFIKSTLGIRVLHKSFMNIGHHYVF